MANEQQHTNEKIVVPERRLGRMPAKVSRKALQFSDFFQFIKIPKHCIYWQKKPALPPRSFGNTQLGDCTRAKQAMAILRMEELEQHKLINITDEEVIRVYEDMENRLYGGGDQGAYEEDALDQWRKEDTTIRDDQGHPYTIDAYLRIDAQNHDQMKAALALAEAKGIAICLNLPAAWQGVDPPAHWDVPPDKQFTGQWMAGSWGGHSMWANGYSEEGVYVDDTWGLPNRLVTWDAMGAYCDEAHLVIDSIDSWRKKSTSDVGHLNLEQVVDAVNGVSSKKIE